MKIYPAIDILGGKAVRLRQGRASDATVYGDPLEMAVKWAGAGAEWLHVVDLDGAFEGEPRNFAVLKEMAAAVLPSKIQVGGGIRSIATVEMLLAAGIRRVVLGTAAVENADFVKRVLAEHPQKTAIGIDAREGTVRVSGWTQTSGVRAIELAQRLEALGAGLVIYTDIARDGVLEGPNVPATKEMLDSTGLSVIASGGISSIGDLRALSELNNSRLDGVIIGKALYEKRFRIEEALTYAG